MSLNNLKYIVKIFLSILVISFIVDKIAFYSLNKISDNVITGESIGRLNHFFKVKDNIDLVVFGSSRARHHIIPDAITRNSFNIGVNSSKIAYSAPLIKSLPKNKKQLILLQIDTENVFSKEYTGEDIEWLTIKYNRNKEIKQETNKLGKENFLQKFYWSLGYNGYVLGILKNYIKPNYDYKTYFGYDPLHVTKEQQEKFKYTLEQEKESENHCTDGLILNKIYDSYLDELKEFCDRNNKELILFTSPIFKDDCKEDNDLLKKVMQKKKITYYDFTDFFKEKNSFEFWQDKKHLSNKGAELFTKEIKKVLAQRFSFPPQSK